MTHIDSITLLGPDPDAANVFYADAFGLGARIRVQQSDHPTTGFRNFTISLVVSQPNIVDLYLGAALDAGAAPIKPASRSLWGYGGVIQAPDGSIWKVASSSKKDSGAATRVIDDIVLLLGASDVKASKSFYVEQGLTIKRSFGGKYAEFDAAPSQIKLALYGRKALAKDAGVTPDGTGSARLTIHGADTDFTDPDGFVWQPKAVLSANGFARAASATPSRS